MDYFFLGLVSASFAGPFLLVSESVRSVFKR